MAISVASVIAVVNTVTRQTIDTSGLS